MHDCMSMFIVQVIIQMNVSDPESSFMQYLAFTVQLITHYTVYCSLLYSNMDLYQRSSKINTCVSIQWIV